MASTVQPPTRKKKKKTKTTQRKGKKRRKREKRKRAEEDDGKETVLIFPHLRLSTPHLARSSPRRPQPVCSTLQELPTSRLSGPCKESRDLPPSSAHFHACCENLGSVPGKLGSTVGGQRSRNAQSLVRLGFGWSIWEAEHVQLRPGGGWKCSMAGLEELKKKLQPLFFDGSGDLPMRVPPDPCDSYVVSDTGTVNLLSRSLGEYNINELGFHKRTSGPEESGTDEKAYRCASHDMHIFGAIGNGASSVVQRAIYIPIHRVLALKKINVFEKEKRQQILNEMRTLCEASCYPGLVEFQGAFYTADSGQISIALEYMDGGSLADVIRVKKFIPEPILAHMLEKVLRGLRYLHEVRHLVHRDIKPANLLVSLKGETKITDFGVSAGLDNTMAMCATFVGTVTYMSPERIRNATYSYAADIWSLGLTVLECATGKFPYDVNGGPANLMLQILDDPSPTPPEDSYSPEFCSFINACLQKDADSRPTCEQLLSHPFIMKYGKSEVDLSSYIRSVVDPAERFKHIADMLAVHYYLLFDGSDGLWHHMRTFYREESILRFSGEVHVGRADIFATLSEIRKKLKGDRPRDKIVHVVEKLHCRANGEEGVVIRVSGSFIVGNQFLICGEGLQAEGMPSVDELSIDIPSKRVGTFREQFFMEPGTAMGCFIIATQDLYIVNA